eukprot:SAG11_NODE_13193_length_666_cov_0.767196_2_plen_68_part_00
MIFDDWLKIFNTKARYVEKEFLVTNLSEALSPDVIRMMSKKYPVEDLEVSGRFWKYPEVLVVHVLVE